MVKYFTHAGNYCLLSPPSERIDFLHNSENVIVSDKLKVQKNIGMTLSSIYLYLSELAAEHVIASAAKQSQL